MCQTGFIASVSATSEGEIITSTKANCSFSKCFRKAHDCPLVGLTHLMVLHKQLRRNLDQENVYPYVHQTATPLAPTHLA
jgi:hypothetical protein